MRVELVRSEKGSFSKIQDPYHTDLVRARVSASFDTHKINRAGQNATSTTTRAAQLPVALPKPSLPQLYMVRRGVETLFDPARDRIDADVTELRIRGNGIIKSVDLVERTYGAPFCDGQKSEGLGLSKEGDVQHQATNPYARNALIATIPLCPDGKGASGNRRYEFERASSGGCGVSVTEISTGIATDPPIVASASFRLLAHSPDSEIAIPVSQNYRFTMDLSDDEGTPVTSRDVPLTPEQYPLVCNQYCRFTKSPSRFFAAQQELSNNLWDLTKERQEPGPIVGPFSGIPPGFKPQRLDDGSGRNIAFMDMAKPDHHNRARGLGIDHKKVCENRQTGMEVALQLYRNKTGNHALNFGDIPTTDRLWAMEEAKFYIKFFYYDPATCQRHKMFSRGSCGCFAENTMITMADGSKRPVQSLEAGDRVWNPKTQQPAVINKMVVGPEKLPLLVVTVGGNTVEVTGKHPFLTPKGDKKAFLLAPGDLVWNGQEDGFVPVDSIVPKHHDGTPPDVFNILLAGSDNFDDHYVEANGIPTGDLFIQNSIATAAPHTGF